MKFITSDEMDETWPIGKDLLKTMTLPDSVVLPPELGSATVNVIGRSRCKCPSCNDFRWRMDLENGYSVLECSCYSDERPISQFTRYVWFRENKLSIVH